MFKIEKTIRRTGVWVSAYLPLLLVILVLLAAPTCLKTGDDGTFHFAKVRALTGFAGSLWLAELFTWICARNRRSVKIAVVLLLALLTFVEFYLFAQFRTRMSDRIVMLVLQTNCKETQEFFMQFVFRYNTLGVAALVVIMTAASYGVGLLLQRKVLPRVGNVVTGVFAWIAGALSTALGIVMLFTSVWYEQIAYPTVLQAGYSIGTYIRQSHNIKSLEAATMRADGKMAPGAEPPTRIVWVIGESFNKHHSPLYGYRLNTQPVLMREYEAGNLVVFADVETMSASTTEVMEQIFSTYDPHVANAADCDDYPLMPTLLRNAGYTVSLHDNQTSRLKGDLKWDSQNMWFLNSAKVECASLCYRNKELKAYDLDFVRSEIKHIPEDLPAMNIFHLLGQHMPAQKRFPPDFEYFSPDVYNCMSGFTEAQKRDLANYDNATLYNDAVLAELIQRIASEDAILVYHSDHGEEVHDFRNRYGRTLEPVTPQIRQCVYEVPLFVYTTPEYRRRHPAMYRRITEAAGRKMNLADMSRLLLDLAEVESAYFNPERSPLARVDSLSW